MITMDLREAIQLQSVYGPGTGAYALVADLGQARDSVLAFLCAPLPYHDSRYDVVTCATCGQRYQGIDFHGNPHVWICADPREGSR